MDECRDPAAANHPIAVHPAERPVRVTVRGHTIAESSRAVVVEEADHPPVAYIPREDVRNEVLKASGTRTRCPFKGEARYFHIAIEGHREDDAVWTYERPCPAVAPIAAYLAFDPERVDAIEGIHPAEDQSAWRSRD